MLLRPGVMLGPREFVGRLPWWLRRVERGGRVLAPGRPDRAIQPVDVRDVVEFALRTTSGPVGTFNVVGNGRETMGGFLEACRAVMGSDVRFEWITDEQWLAAQGVAQWTELPLWRTYAGSWAVSAKRALSAGLTLRPLRSTVEDTWTWLHTDDGSVVDERAAKHGLAADKEAAILGGVGRGERRSLRGGVTGAGSPSWTDNAPSGGTRQAVAGEVLDSLSHACGLVRSSISGGPEHSTKICESPGQRLGAPLRPQREHLFKRFLGSGKVAAKSPCGPEVDPCAEFSRSPAEIIRHAREQFDGSRRRRFGLLAVAEGHERRRGAQRVA